MFSSNMCKFRKGLGQLLFAFFLAFFVAGTTFAQMSFPALTGRVVDDAHIISPNEKNNLEQILAQHEQKTSNQLVLVTLPSLQGLAIEDYGYQLGRAWGIGQKGKNNGVLLIVAPNERKVRIEVGYGLEGVLTDAITSQIIQTIILPKFKNKDYTGGITDGASAILKLLDGGEISSSLVAKKATPADDLSLQSELIIGAIIGLFILFIIFVIAKSGDSSGTIIWIILDILIRIISGGRGGGGSGGSGSGGNSGGGGSFGGGGSSGRW